MADKKPATAATVTLKHIAAALAEAHEFSKKQAEAVLGDFVGLITKHLKKGDRIRIGGLGILQVRKRAARMGRNPQTGETIKIKAKTVVKFRVAKAAKDTIAPPRKSRNVRGVSQPRDGCRQRTSASAPTTRIVDVETIG